MSRIFANFRVLGAYLGTVVLGIIFVVAAIFIGVSNSNTEYLETTGTIVEIEEFYNISEETTDHTVYVDYEAEGQKFEHAQYGSYSSSMNIGDSVTVFYDPANPEQIQAEGFEIIPYVIGGAGVVAILLGGFFLVRKILIGI